MNDEGNAQGPFRLLRDRREDRHQIRLHCQFLGCPIVGDSIYGRKNPTVDLDRHFLHAYRLKIVLPGEKEPRVFTAALPEELEGVLTDLRG